MLWNNFIIKLWLISMACVANMILYAKVFYFSFGKTPFMEGIGAIIGAVVGILIMLAWFDKKGIIK